MLWPECDKPSGAGAQPQAQLCSSLRPARSDICPDLWGGVLMLYPYHNQGQVPLVVDHCPFGANFAQDRRPNWEVISGPFLSFR